MGKPCIISQTKTKPKPAYEELNLSYEKPKEEEENIDSDRHQHHHMFNQSQIILNMGLHKLLLMKKRMNMELLMHQLI